MPVLKLILYTEFNTLIILKFSIETNTTTILYIIIY
jgi:hypothetical protein